MCFVCVVGGGRRETTEVKLRIVRVSLTHLVVVYLSLVFLLDSLDSPSCKCKMCVGCALRNNMMMELINALGRKDREPHHIV